MNVEKLSEKVVELGKQELILLRHCTGEVYAFGRKFLEDTMTENEYDSFQQELRNHFDKLNIDIW